MLDYGKHLHLHLFLVKPDGEPLHNMCVSGCSSVDGFSNTCRRHADVTAAVDSLFSV